MDAAANSRSTLERWIALLVRYWACNMTLAFKSGGYWPGFGYTADEKAEMASLSRSCSFGQFLAWTFIVALIAMPVIVIASLPGVFLISSPGGAALPGSVFFLSEGAAIIVTFTIGIPVAMLLGSALVGKLYRIANSGLPDRATTARYFHKMWFQLTRMAIVMMAILVPAWILIPDNSKLWVTLKLVAPCLGPVWLAISGAYYLSNHLKKSVDS
jgi:hypothetical protein